MAEKNKCCKETKKQGKSCCQEDQTDELKELLQRVQADFENYRKQTEKRVIEMREMAAQDIILQLLPVIDNFELALKNTKHQKHQDFIEGVKLIHTQITSLLKDNGVKEIETEGKLFDPYFHEALMKVESEKPENTILEEFQKGFILHDQIIRHAKVKVSGGMRKDFDNKEENKDKKSSMKIGECENCACGETNDCQDNKSGKK